MAFLHPDGDLFRVGFAPGVTGDQRARSSSAFFTLSPGDTPQFQFTDPRLIGVAGIQRVK
jgi:hypothetical protein